MAQVNKEQKVGEWDEIYAAFDEAEISDSFLGNREQGPAQARESIPGAFEGEAESNADFH